jgi:hypothetical protein
VRRASAFSTAACLLWVSIAHGQDRGAAPGTAPPEATAPTPPDESDVRAAGREQVDTQTGAMVKTYRFGEFDISGRLRTPQLLYFLNRVRAELERAKLGERSFMQELVDSSRDPSL